MAVHRQAEFAATLVHHFLTALGFAASPERPLAFPKWFLFDLGTALQIAWWEQTGVRDHVPEALPKSIELIKGIFGVAGDPAALVDRTPDQALGVRVMAIHLRYFAYRPRPFKAAVVLDSTREADFVDALASLLWKLRDSRAPGGSLAAAESS